MDSQTIRTDLRKRGPGCELVDNGTNGSRRLLAWGGLVFVLARHAARRMVSIRFSVVLRGRVRRVANADNHDR